MSYKEIETAFKRFENPGDALEGHYSGCESVVVNDSEALRHSLLDADGVKQSFLGTNQLDQLLKGVLIGTQIKIEYVGSRKMKAGRTLKDFKVFEDVNAPLLTL